jgi:hypothetical protein
MIQNENKKTANIFDPVKRKMPECQSVDHFMAGHIGKLLTIVLL